MPAPNLRMIAALDRCALREISERDFSVAIREFAEANGWLVEYRYRSAVKLANGQWRGTGPAGFPDLTLVRPPSLVFLELKTMAGRPTNEQRAWLNALKQVPGITAILAKPDDAAAILELLA